MKTKETPLDQQISRIDAGGDAWNGEDEVVHLDVKRPLDKVIPVRLSADHWKALHAEARQLGVGPTTLVRMWVVEKLRASQRAAVA
jgi:hypothetical protein